jgi:hypothetical protein
MPGDIKRPVIPSTELCAGMTGSKWRRRCEPLLLFRRLDHLDRDDHLPASMVKLILSPGLSLLRRSGGVTDSSFPSPA